MDNALLKEFALLITRWLLKIGAGVLATLGISQGSAEEVIGAVVAFVLGLIISLIMRKKDKQSVPTF